MVGLLPVLPTNEELPTGLTKLGNHGQHGPTSRLTTQKVKQQ